MPTTQRVEIIDKKEFAARTLNKEDETFVVYITALKVVDSSDHPFWQAQIFLMNIKKVTIPSKYADYTNVVSLNSMVKLPEHNNIKDYLIDLINNKQPPYGLIYSLKPIELEILKTYIETNLANSFITLYKSLASISILFIHKKDSSFWLFVDYQGLNNLTIKNWYPLPLISKSLNYLGCAKRFTSLNLTNAYH